jgi:hypothetical protein
LASAKWLKTGLHVIGKPAFWIGSLDMCILLAPLYSHI